MHALCATGRPVVVVDEAPAGAKAANLRGVRLADYIEIGAFHAMVRRNDAWFSRVEAVLHQGARTSTLDDDEVGVMAANVHFPVELAECAIRRRIRFVYASSAAVYGDAVECSEERSPERPLNLYARSKACFDQYVRRLQSPLLVGLRYFNVYGPREQHKGPMASMVLQLLHQLRMTGRMVLFGANAGFDDGEQARDFIYVDDVVTTNLWFVDNRAPAGIFNVGTGVARTFNEVARCVADSARIEGTIEYMPFPHRLQGRYQHHTRADINRLRAAGAEFGFRSIEEGIRQYVLALGAA